MQFFLFFCGIQILKVTYFSYLGNVFESLTNKSQNFWGFKKTRRFRVFVLRYRANSKSRKRRKIANLIESKAVLMRCVFETVEYVFCLKELLWICFLFLAFRSNQPVHIFFSYWYCCWKNLFCNVKLKLLRNKCLFLSVSWTHLQKQPFADVLQNRCS